MFSHVVAALLVGLIVVLAGVVSSHVVKEVGLSTVSLPDECKSWNDKYVMEKTLFLTGVLTYALCTGLGVVKVNTRC
jgi:hypothetical protein